MLLTSHICRDRLTYTAQATAAAKKAESGLIHTINRSPNDLERINWLVKEVNQKWGYAAYSLLKALELCSMAEEIKKPERFMTGYDKYGYWLG